MIQYTAERNVQILLSLIKQFGIRKIVISPGSTNICFTASVQYDSFFQIYSSVDERSAAYMACGLAEESGEPVVLSCTGATASRNYMPGLTEAFYRHLPILAITSTQPRERVGQNIPQVLDRSITPKDLVKKSVYIETVHNEEKEWAATVLINEALIALTKKGGGPVHIDLETTYCPDFNIKSLPKIRKIEFIDTIDKIPGLSSKQVAIFIGAHSKWNKELTKKVEVFCELYNGVVLCDHTSNYWGKYRVLPNVVSVQRANRASCLKIDFMIHIGEMSGAYMQVQPKSVWRIHPDGEVRDTFKCLTAVIQCDEIDFFSALVNKKKYKTSMLYYQEWDNECKKTQNMIPELPFSNVWIAKISTKLIPQNATIHFGILNSLRAWNYFELTHGVTGYCNTGGFGIDGCVSSLVGASLADRDKLYFGVVGDLAFFYDMNSIGNRDVGNNIRLIVVNNGKGNEFRNYGNWGSPLGEYADNFVCAAGHFGNKSNVLLKHYAEDLGFKYFSASNKEEYRMVAKDFFSNNISDKPMILEVFTNTEDESKSLELVINANSSALSSAKDIAKNVLGEKGVCMIKKIISKN